jgi:HPt (histidine-containing phosphotransfer) domain-containing protein
MYVFQSQIGPAAMTALAAAPVAVIDGVSSSRSLADVLSLVEVDECRRAGLHVDAKRLAPAANPRNSNESAIDLMSLLGRCLGNIDLILKVLASFRKVGQNDIERLEQAAAAEDFAMVAEIAHRLKGAAGNVSAPGLRQAAASLEHLGREAQGAEIQHELIRLRREWAEFVRCADAFSPAGKVVTGIAAGPSA